MEGKFLKRVQWYDVLFEVGKVYDLDNMIYDKFIRQHIIEPVIKETVKVLPEEVEPEVEQPEAPEALKPVVTSKPLPKHKPKGKRK
jgi:hypothetical protein